MKIEELHNTQTRLWDINFRWTMLPCKTQKTTAPAGTPHKFSIKPQNEILKAAPGK